MKSPLKEIVITLFILTCLPALALALNTLTTGFQVGSSQVTIDAHGTCQKVNATDGKSYFVPTNTASEWSAFRNNKPSGVSLGACEPVRIYLTSGSTWTIPANWNPSANSIEVIGGGGGGGGGHAGTRSRLAGSGGAGGAYSMVENVPLASGVTVGYSIGVAGTAGARYADGFPGGDTYLCSNVTQCSSLLDVAVIVGARGGAQGKYLGTSATLGGQASDGVGAVRYSGGNGYKGYSSMGSDAYGGGGGGAAGPSGPGQGGLLAQGGSGDIGSGGSGGAPNTPGADGNEWAVSIGAAGGGGGGTPTANPGRSSGNYGAGGGGGFGYVMPGGSGGQGIIVITYVPL